MLLTLELHWDEMRRVGGGGGGGAVLCNSVNRIPRKKPHEFVIISFEGANSRSLCGRDTTEDTVQTRCLDQHRVVHFSPSFFLLDFLFFFFFSRLLLASCHEISTRNSNPHRSERPFEDNRRTIFEIVSHFFSH